MSAENKLLLRKLLTAFIGAFVAGLITSWQGLSKEPDFKFTNALLISLIVGALGAGVRAALAILPTNIEPSDAEHTLVGKSMMQKQDEGPPPVDEDQQAPGPVPHPIDPQIVPPPVVPDEKPPKKSRKSRRRKK